MSFRVCMFVGLVVSVLLQQLPRLTPTPGPDNDVAAKLWLIAVDDFRDRTPAQTQVLSDVAYWDAQRAKGHDFERYNAGTKAAEPYAKFHKFPDELIVQDAASGKVLGVEQIPPDVATAWADGVIDRYDGDQ